MSEIKVNTITKRTGSTLTIGESGTTVTLKAGASQSGFGAIDWQSVQTSSFTTEAEKVIQLIPQVVQLQLLYLLLQVQVMKSLYLIMQEHLVQTQLQLLVIVLIFKRS